MRKLFKCQWCGASGKELELHMVVTRTVNCFQNERGEFITGEVNLDQICEFSEFVDYSGNFGHDGRGKIGYTCLRCNRTHGGFDLTTYNEICKA